MELDGLDVWDLLLLLFSNCLFIPLASFNEDPVETDGTRRGPDQR